MQTNSRLGTDNAQKRESIIHAADYAPTYSGNFIASLRAAAKECEARGFRVVWVLPDDVRDYSWAKDLKAETGSPIYFLSRRASLIRNTRHLAHIVESENAVILHTHFSKFDIAAWLAKLACAPVRNFHLLWHVHSAFPFESNFTRRMKDFLKLGVMGRICHVVPVSEPLGADVAERGCPRNRIHVISNGIDVAHATERRKSREQLRQELGIPDSSGVLLGFGWTPVRKAVDLMLKAHAKLAAEGRHLMLVLVGTEELEKFAAGWPERKFASLLRVVPPSEYVGELFAACDVFLSPSRAEGFTYSIGEALVNGTPVVCSDIPTVGWARNAPGVHFCRAGDPDDLARVLRHVLDLPQAERQASAELGRKFIAEKYSAEEWGRSVWKLYEQLLGVRDSQRQIAARPMKEVRH